MPPRFLQDQVADFPWPLELSFHWLRVPYMVDMAADYRLSQVTHGAPVPYLLDLSGAQRVRANMRLRH
jgi:hypothetical protein